jgi:hypothetical protein
LKGLAGFNAAAALSKDSELSNSKVFIARKFEVSEADFAATARGGHFRNATTLSIASVALPRALNRGTQIKKGVATAKAGC